MKEAESPKLWICMRYLASTALGVIQRATAFEIWVRIRDEEDGVESKYARRRGGVRGSPRCESSQSAYPFSRSSEDAALTGASSLRSSNDFHRARLGTVNGRPELPHVRAQHSQASPHRWGQDLVGTRIWVTMMLFGWQQGEDVRSSPWDLSRTNLITNETFSQHYLHADLD